MPAAWDGLADLGWSDLRVHPTHLVDHEDIALVGLWQRGQGMAGTLPFAGGPADQSACAMACLAVIGEAMEILKRRGGDDES